MIGPPFDPFQGAALRANGFEQLALRWKALNDALSADDLIFDDKDGMSDDERRKLWDAREAVEQQIMEPRQPSMAGAILKLRIAANWLRIAEGGDELTADEKTIASAIADLERLAGGAT